MAKIESGRVVKVLMVNQELPSNEVWFTSGPEIKAVSKDRQGALWLTDLDSGENHLLTRRPPEALLTPSYYRLFEDREGNLWIGTEGAGLYRARKQAITVYSEPDGLGGRNIYPIYEDRAGAIWIGAQGLSRFSGGTFDNFTSRDGLAAPDLSAIYEDRAGQLWVATVAGLQVLGVGEQVGPVLGLLVWGEMANAHEYHEEYVARFTGEWQQVVARDYNHPSIFVWVPINESWGVNQILTDRAQQDHAKTMYHLTRSLDPTRLVIDNDGWEHTDETDLFALHDYARTGEELAAKYRHLAAEPARVPRNGREALAFGYRYNGTPFLMTEFGGIAYRAGAPAAENEWGYAGIEPTQEAMLGRLGGLVKALRANPAFAGYCYTQLTDVEQEINGLMTYDRKPKADPGEFAKIFNQ